MANSPQKPASQAADPSELPAGTLIDGRYKVVRVIGVGGTGIVYEVENVSTGQRLALKTLLDPAQEPRLEQEARALARLRSSHVVKVAELGRGDTGVFMVMTLLVGRNLRDVLEAKIKLPLSFIANLAVQVAEGLDEAHRFGLVHRDLKPDNMHLADPAEADTTTDSEPRSVVTKVPHDLTFVTVFDFGVVKMSASEVNNQLTRTGSTVGTPYYMSLEQLRGAGTVDAQSDVYALCVVLYECLAGQRPFEAGTLGDLIFAICSMNPTHLSTMRPDLPREIADVVMQGLSREKKDRPMSMRDLARVFAPYSDPSFTMWLRLGEAAPAVAAPLAVEASLGPLPGAAPSRIAPEREPPLAAPVAPPQAPARASSPPPALALPPALVPPVAPALASAATRPLPLTPPVPPLPPVPPVPPASAPAGVNAPGGSPAGPPDAPGSGPGLPARPSPSATSSSQPELPQRTGLPRPALRAPGTPSGDGPRPPGLLSAPARPTAKAGGGAQLAAPAPAIARAAAGPAPVPDAERRPVSPPSASSSLDEESSTSNDDKYDRETPTEMFTNAGHGHLLEDPTSPPRTAPHPGASAPDGHAPGNAPTRTAAAETTVVAQRPPAAHTPQRPGFGDRPSDLVNGQLPTMSLPADFALPRQSSEDKTAIIDLEALQRNPPNPAPQYAPTQMLPSQANPATTPPPNMGAGAFGSQASISAQEYAAMGHGHAPPAFAMTSRIPFPMTGHGPGREHGGHEHGGHQHGGHEHGGHEHGGHEHAGHAPLHSMMNDSGSYSGVGMIPMHPGSPHPSSMHGSAPAQPTPWQKLAARFVFVTNQLGLKALARFRSATQEQQIIGVMVGTALLAILLVLMFWAIVV